MNAGGYVIVGGVLIGATVAAIALGTKGAAAADLDIRLGSPDINPHKNIRGGKLIIPIGLNISNVHNTSLQVNAVDLDILVDGKSLARVQDFKGFTIKAQDSTTTKIYPQTSILNFGFVVGSQVLRAIGQLRAGQTLKDVLPKECSIKGTIKAEGIIFTFDDKYPIGTAPMPTNVQPK